MTATRDYLTVPALAQSLGVDQDKVLGWIHRGELRALNVAESSTGRPRWRIPAEAWEEFERRRSTRATATSTKPQRRRKRDMAGVVEFY